MKSDVLAEYLLSFPETSEEQPFGPDVDVYKVAGKIFAILSGSGSVTRRGPKPAGLYRPQEYCERRFDQRGPHDHTSNIETLLG